MSRPTNKEMNAKIDSLIEDLSKKVSKVFQEYLERCVAENVHHSAWSTALLVVAVRAGLWSQEVAEVMGMPPLIHAHLVGTAIRANKTDPDYRLLALIQDLEKLASVQSKQEKASMKTAAKDLAKTAMSPIEAVENCGSPYCEEHGSPEGIPRGPAS